MDAFTEHHATVENSDVQQICAVITVTIPVVRVAVLPQVVQLATVQQTPDVLQQRQAVQHITKIHVVAPVEKTQEHVGY